MNVRIKRFDADLPVPAFATAGAAAFDLAARVRTEIAPGTIGYIPLNIAVETPEGHFLLIAARSGTHKRGLMLANGIGIIDPDFSGDEDEIAAAYFNFSKNPVIVERGERIAQGLFIKAERAAWNETDTMGNPTRGGFGSTGHK